MEKRRQYVAMVLDRSGSMDACRKQVIDGFNEFVSGLKQNKDQDTRMTLTLFDTPVGGEGPSTGLPAIDTLFHGTAITEVENLTWDTYEPRGMTPLWDAVGQVIHTVTTDVAAMSSPKPAIVFVVFTDGLENASREYTPAKVKELIEARTAEGNWTFVYLGANQDAWGVAQTVGIPQGNTKTYKVAETQGTMDMVGASTRSFVASGEQQTRGFFTPQAAPTPPKVEEKPREKPKATAGRDPWAKS